MCTQRVQEQRFTFWGKEPEIEEKPTYFSGSPFLQCVKLDPQNALPTLQLVAEFGKSETIFTGLAGQVAGSRPSGILPPGVLFLTSPSPPKLGCQFPEVGTTTVGTISGH